MDEVVLFQVDYDYGCWETERIFTSLIDAKCFWSIAEKKWPFSDFRVQLWRDGELVREYRTREALLRDL